MNIEIEGSRTLKRILATQITEDWIEDDKSLFYSHLEQNFTSVFSLLFDIYSHQYDSYYHLQNLVFVLTNGIVQCSDALGEKDQKRLNNPAWFLD